MVSTRRAPMLMRPRSLVANKASLTSPKSMFFPHRQVRVDPGVYPLHNDADPNHVDAVPPYKVGHALPAITQPEGRRGGAKAPRAHGGGCLGRCCRSQAPRCHIGGGARALNPTAVLGVPP